MVSAEGNGGENVFFVARNYDSDRNLAVIGAIGCIESATARVEADFSAKVAAERGFKSRGVELRGMDRGWSDVLRHRVQNIFEDAGVGRKGDCILYGVSFLCDPVSSGLRSLYHRGHRGPQGKAPHKMRLPPGSSQVIRQGQR
jgi:hypothetical protein